MRRSRSISASRTVPELVRHDARPDQPSRPGRRRTRVDLPADGAGPAGTSPAVDHRPVDRGGPAVRVKDGLHLSYNGELYNYRELRDELESTGVRFGTESDTEVVLEAWRALGHGRARPAPRHVRVRDLRRAARRRSRSPAIRWASSRCTSCRAATACCSHPSSRPGDARSARSSPSIRGALVASTLFYFLPEERCAIAGRVQAARLESWAQWRAGRHQPEPVATGSAVEEALRGRGRSGAGPGGRARGVGRPPTSSPTYRWRRS